MTTIVRFRHVLKEALRCNVDEDQENALRAVIADAIERDVQLARSLVRELPPNASRAACAMMLFHETAAQADEIFARENILHLQNETAWDANFEIEMRNSLNSKKVEKAFEAVFQIKDESTRSDMAYVVFVESSMDATMRDELQRVLKKKSMRRQLKKLDLPVSLPKNPDRPSHEKRSLTDKLNACKRRIKKYFSLKGVPLTVFRHEILHLIQLGALEEGFHLLQRHVQEPKPFSEDVLEALALGLIHSGDIEHANIVLDAIRTPKYRYRILLQLMRI
jgi:hypothetical protein